MSLMDKLRIVEDSTVELTDDLEPDPVPDERPPARAKKVTAAPKPAARRAKTTTALAKEVGEDLGSILEMGAAIWGMRDQCCAPILEQQAKPIAESLTAILARNPRLLDKFAQADTALFLMQAGTAVRATMPVLRAVYRNHVVKGPPEEPEEERVPMSLDDFPVFQGIARDDRS